MPQNKYHNRKIKTADGIFDSKKEYKRWLELKGLQEQGLITDLHRQVPYELVPHQIIDGKVAERAVKYFADFAYIMDGQQIVEDTKGLRTADYIIKRKLMLERHGIKIKEV